MQYTPKQLFSSGTVKAKPGQFAGIFVASGTPTIKVNDSLGNGTPAADVFTIAGALTPGVHAANTITGGGVIADGEVIVIGAITYRWKTIMSQAYDLQLSGVLATDLATLKKAINGTGIVGTDYYTGTVAHALVVGGTLGATTLRCFARIPGTASNALATTTTAAMLGWQDATLGGGGGGSTTGVVGEGFSINGRTYTWVDVLSETNGASAVADQIFYGGSDAVALDNMKLALNGGGVYGSQYSTGTSVNIDVVATTNTNTQQTVEAINFGTAGNSITATETCASSSWANPTLAGGTGTAGKTMIGSFVSVAGSVYRFPSMGFANGLYVNMIGAGDITIMYD